MDEKAQSLANHVRYDPMYHFVLVPVFAINIIVAIINLVRSFTLMNGWLLLMALALAMVLVKMRNYANKVQDRVIRMEERVRLGALLPEPLRSRIGELTDSQIVGLRFAADQEVAGLVKRALDEKLDRQQIKEAVTKWRADYSRV